MQYYSTYDPDDYDLCNFIKQYIKFPFYVDNCNNLSRQIKKKHGPLNANYVSLILNRNLTWNENIYHQVFICFLILLYTERNVIQKRLIYDQFYQVWRRHPKHIPSEMVLFKTFKYFFPYHLFFVNLPTDYNLTDNQMNMIDRKRKAVLSQLQRIYKPLNLHAFYSLNKTWKIKIARISDKCCKSSFEYLNAIHNFRLSNRDIDTQCPLHITFRQFIRLKKIFLNYRCIGGIKITFSYLIKKYRPKEKHDIFFLLFKTPPIISKENFKYKNKMLEISTEYKIYFTQIKHLINLLIIHNLKYRKDPISVSFVKRNFWLPLRQRNSRNMVDLFGLRNAINEKCNVSENDLPFRQRHILKNSCGTENAIYSETNYTIADKYNLKSNNVLFSPRHIPQNTKSIEDVLCEKGLTSLYDIPEDKVVAHVKNRVTRIATLFKRKTFQLSQIGKKLVTVYLVNNKLTVSRYSRFPNYGDEIVSYNINWQGTVHRLYCLLIRFLNDNKHFGCQITNQIFVSNICTTTDTIHSGILNTHSHRTICQNNKQKVFSYKQKNFPSLILFNNLGNNFSTSVINHRTVINTCKISGSVLYKTLKSASDIIRQNNDISEELIEIAYIIQRQLKQLLPRNIINLIQILFVEDKLSKSQIVSLFADLNFFIDRLHISSNECFTTSNFFMKHSNNKLINNTSIKTSKILNKRNPPPILSKSRLQKILTKKQIFSDMGSCNIKKDTLYRCRGRNATLLDCLLTSPDSFFYSKTCKKLFLKLLRKETLKNKPRFQKTVLAILQNI